MQAMEEQAAQVGRGRKLANALDIALPAEQRRGSDPVVLGAVIDLDPSPESLVQLLERKREFAVQVVQELLS